jgi:hypothetical protein
MFEHFTKYKHVNHYITEAVLYPFTDNKSGCIMMVYSWSLRLPQVG